MRGCDIPLEFLCETTRRLKPVVASHASNDNSAGNLVELGDFLRSRRNHLSPDAGGFALSPRRKAPGLRRAEVADLAGISESWYTRIELGTAGVPSLATLYAVAQALRLDQSDRRYVFELAGFTVPAAARAPDALLSPAMNHVAMTVPGAATMIMDRYCTPHCWNAVADGIFRWSRHEDDFDRNVIVGALTDPYYRSLCGTDEEYQKVARSFIGTFRRAFTTFGPTPLSQRVFEFAMGHPFFRTIWNESPVAETFTDPGPIDRHVPDLGALRFDVVDLVPVGQTNLIIRVLTPRDEDTRIKLMHLESIGTARSIVPWLILSCSHGELADA